MATAVATSKPTATTAAATTTGLKRQSSLLPTEDLNFLRLFMAIKKEGTKVCSKIFHRYFSRDKKVLYQQLLPFQKKLKPFMFQNQYDLVYGDPNQETDSTKFDITLFLLLIRKTCPLLQPPKKGWNRRPSNTDISEGANLERLRIERNQLAHGGGNESLETLTFNKRFTDATFVLVALGGSAQEINDYKTMPLVDESFVSLEEQLSILHDNLLQHVDVSFIKYSENEKKVLALERSIHHLQTKLQQSENNFCQPKVSPENIKHKLQSTYQRSESTVPCLEWDSSNKGFFQLEDIFIEPRIHAWKHRRSQSVSSPQQHPYFSLYDLFTKNHHQSDHQDKTISACLFSDPGKGKSILMKKLALDYARNKVDFKRNLPHITLVFFIKCRELLEFESLQSYMRENLIRDASICPESLNKMIHDESRQCLFLVDGLDEIMNDVDGSLPSVLDLNNLLEGRLYGGCSIVATSRPSGLKTLEKQFSLFGDLYIISALENEDIKDYIRKYFSEKDDTYCDTVFDELIGDDHIRDLVSSPLTLSIVCNIYDNAEGPVPHSITKLYHELVRQMIQKFKTYYGFNMREQPSRKQGARRVSECLLKSVGYVAFQSLREGNDYFEHQDLANYLSTKQKKGSLFSKAKHWLSGLNSASVLQLGFITADTGPNPRKLNLRYQFEPKMCQKYIAAEYIVNQLLKHGTKRMNELMDIDISASSTILRTNHELCLFIVDSLGRRGEKGLCKELFNNLFKDFGSL